MKHAGCPRGELFLPLGNVRLSAMLERIKTLLKEEIRQTAGMGVEEEDEARQQAVVARQPIFDARDRVWGYELLYRRPSSMDKASFSSGSVATASVIVNGLEMIRPGVKDSQKILINFPGDLIETQVVKLLPRDICVIEILEDVLPTPEILEAITSLKNAGYTVAVDDYTGQKNLEPFLPLADIIKVDVLAIRREELAVQAQRLQRTGCRLLAEKVESREMADYCRRLGFSLFQGYFFSRPELVKGKKISTSQALRMRILALCIGENVDFKAVSDTILHDPVITARFLQFINSAYFGLTWRIRSVYHALNLVGPVTFMQWLCVSMLATLENGPISQELAFIASQRAKFLETLGKRLESRRMLPSSISPPTLFLAGLFSLLESATGMPLQEVLDGVPIEEDVLVALAGGESAYSPWLRLMNHHERGEWEKSMVLTDNLCLAEDDLAAAYQAAIEWSAVFFNNTMR